MDEVRTIDEEINLIKYYPNDEIALEWYQDLALCKQVDNRDSVYDLPLLQRMYHYLNENGDLFYIEYQNELCGDVCLKSDGEVCIVVAKPYQNKHIGRRVIAYIRSMAKEKGLSELRAEIYAFNTQSRKMFERVGFQQIAEEQYVLHLK
jgi:N-acetylglutamate synthase-like GNAT family acetyltransferase